MGTTAAALHILMPADNDPAAVLLRAYERLGYVATTDGKPDRKTVVLEGGAGQFVSAYDSDNDQLDTGELKELAVALSAELRTVALVTSIYDSDAFVFLLYYRGKQVDGALGGELWTRDGISMLTAKARPAKWRAMFKRDGPRLKAGAEDSIFAESGLSEWCRAAGLDPSRATTILADFDGNGAAGHKTLLLERGARPAPSDEARTDRQAITFFRSDDDQPYLQLYPAAWPVDPQSNKLASWGSATSGPGVRGLRFRLDFDAATDARLRGATLLAWPFFNGQITSFKAAAIQEWRDLDEPVAGAVSVTKEAPDFELPPTESQSRKQFILMLQVSLRVSAGHEAIVRPVLESMDGAFAPFSLPPVRLRAIEPAWIPAGGGCPPEIALRLNEPAVASHVAILPQAAQPERTSFKTLFEAWLASLTLAGVTAMVRTEKKRTGTGRGSKAAWSGLAESLIADKRWNRSFDAQHDYGAVAIDLTRDGSPFPFAGATMSGSSDLRGGFWLINEPAVYRACRTSRETQEALFASWVTQSNAVQAWIDEAVWFPFPTGRTLYERVIPAIGAPYNGPQLQSLVEEPSWPERRLRFAGRRVWLGEPLAAQLDPGALERVATIQRTGRLVEIALRAGATLGELEAALAPILPSDADVLAVLEEKAEKTKAAAQDQHALNAYAFDLERLGTALTDIAGREAGPEKLVEAIALLDEALALVDGPSWPQGFAALHKSRSTALVRLGERTNAIDAFKKAIAGQRAAAAVLGESLEGATPGHRNVWVGARVHLGTALAALGEREASTQSLEEAAELFHSAVLEYSVEEDISLAGLGIADESNTLTRASLSAREGFARLAIAVRTGDRAGAQTALSQIDEAAATLRASQNGKVFGDYESWGTRARQLANANEV